MKITLKVSKISALDVDTLNLFLWEDDALLSFSELPQELISSIKEASKREDFHAKTGEMLVVSSKGLISAYKIIITGLGKKEDFDSSSLSEQIAVSMRKSREFKAAKAAIVLNEEILSKLGAKNASQIAVESVNLSTYKFNKYKSEEEKNKNREIEEVVLVVPPSKLAQAEQGMNEGEIISKAVLFTRDLVNEPPQLTTPSFLAEQAVKIGKNSKDAVRVKIMEKDEVEKLGMNAFLGVSRGSDEPPKFIILKYKPPHSKRKVAVIGKGITFDTGGLSLKPSSSMETMKLDMAGAAAILGIFSVIWELKIPVELVGIVAACENMPSGKALKPGDILRAMNGKTIEVLNTDAEGRLTLADAISYANQKEKPDEIIDLATLTGACMVALGEDIAGLFGNNDKLQSDLEKASKETGELIWRMPMEKKYKELNKSHIADVKNISTGKYAGSITAALFLNEFAGKTTWAHLDIAGPSFMEKDTPLIPYGGAGFGVRLILRYLSSL